MFVQDGQDLYTYVYAMVNESITFLCITASCLNELHYYQPLIHSICIGTYDDLRGHPAIPIFAMIAFQPSPQTP